MPSSDVWQCRFNFEETGLYAFQLKYTLAKLLKDFLKTRNIPEKDCHANL
jgi:hypothetical protein